MESKEKIQNYIFKMKEVYEHTLKFIDNTDPDSDSEENYKKLLQIIDIYGIQRNKEQFNHFISLLVHISNNHHHHSSFFDRIERILLNYRNTIQENNTNIEIFEEFESNKRLVYFLIKEKILQIDSKIQKIMGKIEFNGNRYSDFFYETVKNDNDKDESKFKENEQKRQLGENDSYICSLIRQDSVEKFIEYVNRLNLPLSGRIKPSIYETNSFLTDKEPTLIEYAAFFGSIQIYQYLYLNQVKVNGSLWLYGVHSNNFDLLRNYIESQGIKPNDETWEEVLNESIKCHHNEIAKYIQENLIDDKKIDENIKLKNNTTFNERVFEKALKYDNYLFLPTTDFNENYAFFYFYQYNYQSIVDILINSQIKIIESKIIFKIHVF